MVIAGGIALGVMAALSMRKRVEELRQLERIIGYMESEIRYKHALLQEAIESVSGKVYFPFDSWLDKLSVILKQDRERGFPEIWEDSLQELRGLSHLKKDDVKYLISLGQVLGYLDVSAQQRGMELEKENIHNLIVGLDKELANNMKVSIIMGTLGGIFLVLLLL